MHPRRLILPPPLDPIRPVTSWLISPKWLTVYRLVLAIYSTVVFWGSFISTAISGGAASYWYYFTNLSYLGLNVYLVLATLHTFVYARYGKNLSQGWLIALHLLYATVIVSHIVTPVTYYALLYTPGTTFDTTLDGWANYSKHGGDFALMVLEVFINRNLLYISDVTICLITGIVYMCWMFLVHAFANMWPYPFLGWDKGGGVAKWYIIMLALFAVAFLVMWVVHWGKEKLVNRLWLRRSGKDIRVPTMNASELVIGLPDMSRAPKNPRY